MQPAVARGDTPWAVSRLVLYGGLVYLVFLGTFLYAIAFVGNLPVPKTIDSGEPGPHGCGAGHRHPASWALCHPAQRDGAAGVQALVDRFVPRPVERTTYVLLASLALLLLYWQWRPIPATVWSVTNPAGAVVLQAVFWIGWGVVLLSTFLINHFELFGLRQVYARLRGETLPPPVFKTPLLYKKVRHPIYLGFLLAFWATPTMTVGHLLFAVATTGYILIGIYLEERDLIALFGDQYRRYREQVSMLIPLPGRKAEGSPRSLASSKRR